LFCDDKTTDQLYHVSQKKYQKTAKEMFTKFGADYFKLKSAGEEKELPTDANDGDFQNRSVFK
jgi:hypothetical protein